MSSSRKKSNFELFKGINIEGNTSKRNNLIERHDDIWSGMPSTGNPIIDDAVYKKKLDIDILRQNHIKSKYKGNIYDNPNKSVKKALAKYYQNQRMETWFPNYNPYNHQHYRIMEKVMDYSEKNLEDFFKVGNNPSDLYHLGGFDVLPGVRPTTNAALNDLLYEKRKQIDRLRVYHIVSEYPGNIADNPDPDIQKDWIEDQMPPTIWFPDYNPSDPIHINIIEKLQEYRDKNLSEFYLVGPQLSTIPKVDGGYKKYNKIHNKKYKKTHNKNIKTKNKKSLKIKK